MLLNKWLCLPLTVVMGLQAQAEQPAAVNSGAGGTAGFQGVVLSGQASRASTEGITINIANSCFGTNLRHVQNPIAKDSIITFYITLNDKGTNRLYHVKYPAAVVSLSGNASEVRIPDGDTSGNGVVASYAGNNVRITVPINFTTKVDEEGNISDDFDVKLGAVRFHQSFAPGKETGREYMGFTGDLSGNVYTSHSKDGKQYSISAFFPGENGFCGGYFSPLMVFFDDKRPQFNASVDFPLIPGMKTRWPEKGAPGAFIAVDRDGDKKITKAEELFGNLGDKYKNGFEALREFDSNKDDVIDAKDKEFAKLLLWFDRNGDGISDAGELVPLKKRVKSISLKYDSSQTSSMGDRAEVRERSTFVFKEKGKEKQGAVIDLWFAPQPK
ncbi:EF-hand domain-containing protein [Bdellovibrio sp. 22V]|uniref:EF-hand domain-containing protein n=1 Tax=Bdellovibrio TaxID=958 RepID=UPI002543C704|nr:EF-hand domain-containing protein [Bdellovibrio sp. 22V]WII72311.1 EF-hand domain-containing protein [Bdellovibrio sp. 22V]